VITPPNTQQQSDAMLEAAPAFAPQLSQQSRTSAYDDGRVKGTIVIEQLGKIRHFVIYEWRSFFPGNGHSVEALRWLREQGADLITVSGVGLVEDNVNPESTAYWRHMHSLGLVDILLDDMRIDITPTRSSGAILQ
jgi:hypothetical protein